jgi:hypothetical protein
MGDNREQRSRKVGDTPTFLLNGQLKPGIAHRREK